MAEDEKTKIDALTDKCSEKFEKFSNSKSGNLILDFIMFKKNLIPYTFQIVYVLGVLAAWVAAMALVFAQGTIASFFLCVGIIIVAPFVIHYALELVKQYLWGFLVHVFNKIIVPIWNTIVIRFLAGVLPETLPFMYERFLKVIDIYVDKLEPFLDACINGILTVYMTTAATLKGVIWLPKKVCQRLGRWLDKPQDSSVQDK